MFDSPFQPTFAVDEKLEELTETVESLVKRLDAQDAEITKLKNEIAEMRRPKPVRIVRHDVDNERAELR